MYERHGMYGTPTYYSWIMLIQRCTNPNNKDYPNYGGRGIKVCAAWLVAFYYFLYDMGEAPIKHQIDRIDNDGPYSPYNCRWVTCKENMRNMSRNHMLTFGDKTQALAAWADDYGLLPGTLWSRLFQYNWPIAKALTAPLYNCGPKKT